MLANATLARINCFRKKRSLYSSETSENVDNTGESRLVIYFNTWAIKDDEMRFCVGKQKNINADTQKVRPKI